MNYLSLSLRSFVGSGLFCLVTAVPLAAQPGGEFAGDLRQGLQRAVEDAGRDLRAAGLPSSLTISVLPLGRDRNAYVEGLLKTAVTRAGLTYVEGREDPLFDQILREVEWDLRKEDMLDPDTVVRFGALKATQALLYGTVREATLAGGGVFVEVELHLTMLATKQHLWGGHYTQRLYPEAFVEGIVQLDQDVRDLLRQTVERATATLQGSPKLSSVTTVALAPVAGDLDGYVASLFEAAVSRTRLRPARPPGATLTEITRQLRDTPGIADAVAYGALRDLSRRPKSTDFRQRTDEITVEVQFRIQDARDGTVLWSETLSGTREVVEEQTWWEFMTGKWIYVGATLGGLFVLLVLLRIFAATQRPR